MRYIVAVGSELHFTRAAERVHVAQPSLSKQIRNVEAELGVELFKRTRKKVEVTEPGRVFIENAEQALLYAHRAASMARAAGEGQLGKLFLGVSALVDLRLFFRIRTAFERQYPEVKFQFVSGQANELVEGVMQSDFHAGLIELPVRCRGLAVLNVHREPLLLAVKRNDRLATAMTIAPRQLKGRRLILLSSTIDLAHDKILASFQAQGYRPEKTLDVISLDQAFGFVMNGEGVAAVRTVRSAPKDIVLKSLAGLPLLDCGFVYRRDIRSPLVRNLLQLVREVFAKERAQMKQDTTSS